MTPLPGMTLPPRLSADPRVLRAELSEVIRQARPDPVTRSLAVGFLNLASDDQLVALAQLINDQLIPALEKEGEAGLQTALEALGAPPEVVGQVLGYVRGP